MTNLGHLFAQLIKEIKNCSLIVFGIIYLSSCSDSTEIKFHYSYDKNKEQLDTANDGTNPWYLDAQKKFVSFYNASHSTKCLIDPETLSGVFWMPQYYSAKPLTEWEIPGETKYMIVLSSQGIGFEGYAIASFVRQVKGKFDIDVSYGAFSNNSEGEYASSFYRSNNTNQAFRDSVLFADSAYLPKLGIGDADRYQTQYYSKEELTSLRKHNSLFFGIVPPDVVKRSMKNQGGNICIEVTPEEYEYKLLNLKTKFRDEVKRVDQQYFLNTFQEDWRYLISFTSYDQSLILDSPDYSIRISTQSFPTNENNPSEQYSLPNMDIQVNVLNTAPPHIQFSPDNTLTTGLIHSLKLDSRFLPILKISEDNAIETKIITPDSTVFIFDTSNLPNPKYKEKTAIGNRLSPIAYVGSAEKGVANGKGILYLIKSSVDTAKWGYFALSGNFKNGVPDGAFDFSVTDRPEGVQNRMITSGFFDNGKLSGEVTRYDRSGLDVSESKYKKGELVTDNRTVFHYYDLLSLWNTRPKISDAYYAYIDNELAGMEIPNDTAFIKDNASVFVRSNYIVYQSPAVQMIIPYYRDYATGTLSPSGKVTAYYKDGGVLLSNWDPVYIIGGNSLYHNPNRNDWVPAIVTNGAFAAQYPVEQVQRKGGWFSRFVKIITGPIVAPVRQIAAGIDVLKGQASLNDFANRIKSQAEAELGTNVQIAGDIVHIIGKAGEKIVDVTYPVFRAMQNYNDGLFPMASAANMLETVNKKLGINNKAIDNIYKVTALVPGLRSKIDSASALLMFKTADISGTATKKLGTYLALAAGGFPKAMANFYPTTGISGNLIASATSSYLTKLFNNIFNHQIQVDGDILKSFSITGPKEINFDPSLKSININFAGGNISAQDGALKSDFTIDHCSLELIPVIIKKDEHFLLTLHAIITYLDLKNSTSDINKMIAWAIQTEFLNEKQLDAVDLTKMISRDIEVRLKGQKELSTNTFRQQLFTSTLLVENVSWSVTQSVFTITAAVRIKKQKAATPFTDMPTKEGFLPKILGVDCSKFPDISKIDFPGPIQDPDLMLKVDPGLIEMLVSDLFSKSIEIPLSQDSTNEMSNHYFVIDKINNFTMRTDNMITVGLSGDAWFRNKLLKTKMRLNDFEIVIIPFVVKKDTSFYLSFPAQVKLLNISGIPATLNMCLANFINLKGYFNKDTADITKSIAFKIKNPLDSAFSIQPVISSAVINSDNRSYLVQLKSN